MYMRVNGLVGLGIQPPGGVEYVPMTEKQKAYNDAVRARLRKERDDELRVIAQARAAEEAAEEAAVVAAEAAVEASGPTVANMLSPQGPQGPRGPGGSRGRPSSPAPSGSGPRGRPSSPAPSGSGPRGRPSAPRSKRPSSAGGSALDTKARDGVLLALARRGVDLDLDIFGRERSSRGMSTETVAGIALAVIGGIGLIFLATKPRRGD